MKFEEILKIAKKERNIRHQEDGDKLTLFTIHLYREKRTRNSLYNKIELYATLYFTTWSAVQRIRCKESPNYRYSTGEYIVNKLYKFSTPEEQKKIENLVNKTNKILCSDEVNL